MQAHWSFHYQPAEPVQEKRLVDARDRTQSAAGVAVHRGVAHRRFAAIAGRQQQGILDIRQQPHAGPSDPGLDVLQGNVIGLPGKLTAYDALYAGYVGPNLLRSEE